MAELTPNQEATRARVEGLISLASPFLNVLLGVGERISRIAEPTDHEYYPIRPGPEPVRVPSDLVAHASETSSPPEAEEDTATAGDSGAGAAAPDVVSGTAEEIPLDP